ncbi:RNA polymerase, sigma-24 subunit, ECF subfamily [Kribbella flavida DSM 17836]|uniref:RNA polymerase, sigma-24 subunit, ECF subfamily n=1 Tax=Kribbella flavida (strain DSM 17836 / JCM 10339 / NBRC 14399) TaxID=479435 RepID=D2Q085_KRIFD|nr:RNA polymerase subunit sigma-70 [Kribbella flavida]ADB31877.1 RNA polymerase, sigma-24 subunit, ECF subfamily [Kribbella flavida DSM 17836]
MTAGVLERARSGDADAFRELTTPYYRELHLHCYRMLGSVVDADDLMQEILLAAWNGLPGFAGRASVRTWLYRIATNRCLNAIRATKRRPRIEPVPPFEPPEPSRRGDVTWLQPYPDAWLDELSASPEVRAVRREDVELAFVVALQRLPPRQTATLVLVDVLGYAVAEVADLLETTPTAVKGALQRARAAVGKRGTPSDSGRGLGDPGEREVARRFAEAFVADDIEAVKRLLTDGAWLAMPPAPHEYHGPEAIAAFLRASADGRRTMALRLEPTRSNRQPAYTCSFVDHQDSWYAGQLVLTIQGDRITGITRFLEPTLEKVLLAPTSSWTGRAPGGKTGRR